MIGLSIYLTSYYSQKATKNFKIFYTQGINSKLKSFTSSASGINLILENDLEYRFRIRTSVEEKLRFSSVARPNDVLEKKAYSDTLKLVSRNKIYQFVCYYDGQVTD